MLRLSEAGQLLGNSPNTAARSEAGKKAVGEGDLTESQVDVGLSYYHRQRLACGVPTYPKVLVRGFNQDKRVFEVRFTEQGAPDRAVAIAQLGGRLCWLEIKSWQREDKMTLTKGLHQFRQMKDSVETGGALGFYLVKWKTKTGSDWRLHPVQGLAEEVQGLAEENSRILFRRNAGLPVDSSLGWPDWLDVVVKWVKAEERERRVSLAAKLGATPADIMAFVLDYLAENNIPPTFREIGDGAVLERAERKPLSSSVVRYNLEKLRDAGLVDWTPGQSRTLRVEEGG